MNYSTTSESTNNFQELLAMWRLAAIELPAMGMRRETTDSEDYSFAFHEDGTATVCL